MDTSSLYDDDESHPIARIDVIDVVVTLKGGGAYYGLVIETPLGADERSQKRLLQKLENCLQDMYALKNTEARGSPATSEFRLHVAIHPDSDPVIFALLEKCKPWVEENHAALIVRTDLGPPFATKH